MPEVMAKAKTRGTLYTQEFKQTAIGLVESGQTVAAVGRSLRVPEQTLSYWVRTLSVRTAEQMSLARSQVKQSKIAELRTKESKTRRSTAKQKVITRAKAKQKEISGLQADWVRAKQSKLNRLQVERLSAMQAKLACSRATISKAKLGRRERLDRQYGRLQGVRSEGMLGPFAVEQPQQTTGGETKFTVSGSARPESARPMQRSFVSQREMPWITAIPHDLLTADPGPRSNMKDVVSVNGLAARIHAVITTEHQFAAVTPQHLLCAAIRVIALWSNSLSEES